MYSWLVLFTIGKVDMGDDEKLKELVASVNRNRSTCGLEKKKRRLISAMKRYSRNESEAEEEEHITEKGEEGEIQETLETIFSDSDSNSDSDSDSPVPLPECEPPAMVRRQSGRQPVPNPKYPRWKRQLRKPVRELVQKVVKPTVSSSDAQIRKGSR